MHFRSIKWYNIHTTPTICKKKLIKLTPVLKQCIIGAVTIVLIGLLTSLIKAALKMRWSANALKPQTIVSRKSAHEDAYWKKIKTFAREKSHAGWFPAALLQSFPAGYSSECLDHVCEKWNQILKWRSFLKGMFMTAGASTKWRCCAQNVAQQGAIFGRTCNWSKNWPAARKKAFFKNWTNWKKPTI